ncbi:MAG: galactose ABC transporter substrate-binding protein [Clostridia bacterium]|nr:galactose ABC transporter substrate-binding protein [Clostridia bacterium]
MKKFLAMLLAAVMLLGVGSVALAEGTAFVSWYTFGDVYLTSVRTALDDAFTALEINVTDKDSNGVQQTQIDDINTALVTGTDALVINLVDSGAIGTAQNLMDTAAAQDKPAVFFNRAVSTDDAEAAALFLGYEKTAFIGTNFEDAGKMQGTMIGEYVLANYDALDLNGDGVISYVMFKGDEANQEAIARTKYGVENADEVLTAAGKPALVFYDESNANKYLVDLNGTWSNAASFEYLQTILAQYNEENGNMVELIICNNDDMAIGAVNALNQAGYNTGDEGSKTIPVFGVDAVDAAKTLIAEGKMTGTIKQDAVGMAEAVATITNNLITGADKFSGLAENVVIVDDWFVQIPYAVYTGEE